MVLWALWVNHRLRDVSDEHPCLAGRALAAAITVPAGAVLAVLAPDRSPGAFPWLAICAAVLGGSWDTESQDRREEIELLADLEAAGARRAELPPDGSAVFPPRSASTQPAG